MIELPARPPAAGFARRGRDNRIEAAFTLAFVAVTCLTLGLAVRIQVASYTAMPFSDLWDELPTVRKAFAGSLGAHDLWAQHNEHRILLSRLQFIADYEFFSGRLVLLLASILTSSLLISLALAWPFALVWRRPAVALGFFAFALSATLSPEGMENLSWPFQVGFVQVYAFAIAAILLAVCWLRVEHQASGGPHLAALASIIVLGGAATYSMANGLAVWPVLLALMVLRGVGKRSVAVVALAGGAFVASYLWAYKPSAVNSPSKSIHHPFGLAHYIVVYLGHPAEVLGSKAEQVVGALGLVLFIVLLAAALRDRMFRLQPATLFGLGTGVFVLVTAAQTALGRLEFGAGQALAGRYSLGAGIFWVSLCSAAAPYIANHVRVELRSDSRRLDMTGLAFAALLVGASLAVNLETNPSNLTLDQIQRRSEPMLVAFVAGVRDDNASLITSPTPNAVIPQLKWLQAKRLGPWSSGVGNALDTVRRRVRSPDTLPSCRGSIDSTAEVRGGTRLDGWIVAPSSTRASRALDVVAAGGSSLGVGLIDVYRPDVKAAGASTSNFSGFVAYTRPGAADLVLFSARSAAPLCALKISGH